MRCRGTCIYAAARAPSLLLLLLILLLLFHGCSQVRVRFSEVILYGRLQVGTLSVSVVRRREAQRWSCHCPLSGGERHRGGRFSEVNFIKYVLKSIGGVVLVRSKEVVRFSEGPLRAVPLYTFKSRKIIFLKLLII